MDGHDVLTGVGSLFMTGGAGRDTFFLDGRLSEASWSTITDFERGQDRMTIWGWREGVSRIAAAEEEAGAQGYQGLTLTFVDLRADGATNSTGVMHSVTLSGLSLSDFGAENVEQLNIQINLDANKYFSVGSTVDVHGSHGYLSIA
jgi:serralysin